MPAGREVASVLEILGLMVLLLVIVGAGAADAGDEYGDGGGDERWRTFVNNAIFGVVLVCFDGKVFFFIQLLLFCFARFGKTPLSSCLRCVQGAIHLGRPVFNM